MNKNEKIKRDTTICALSAFFSADESFFIDDKTIYIGNANYSCETAENIENIFYNAELLEYGTGGMIFSYRGFIVKVEQSERSRWNQILERARVKYEAGIDYDEDEEEEEEEYTEDDYVDPLSEIENFYWTFDRI